MSHLLGIPVPSLEQIIVGTELVFILYVPKKIVSRLDNNFRYERNRIIKAHVKNGHLARFLHCLDGDCATLQKSSKQRPVQPELPTVVDIEL